MTDNVRHLTTFCQGHNDFLDDVLDGKPFHMVSTPAFRRSLRRRASERRIEDEAYERALRQRLGMRG